jgi:Flp pilus assembly pilin Flp
MRRHLRGHDRRQRGAAAVEFAMVVPLLVLVLVGIIEYGLYFADDIALRQQTREVARQGALAQWGPGGCSLPSGTDGSTDVRNLMCRARADALTSSGPVDVKVRFIDSSSAATPNAAYPTAVAIRNGTSTVSIRVCLSAPHQSITHFVPFPSNARIRSKVDYRIENAVAPTTVETPGSTAPTAAWAWC